MLELIQQIGGWKALFTKGIMPRMILTGTIIGTQWLIYDTFKTLFLHQQPQEQQLDEEVSQARTTRNQQDIDVSTVDERESHPNLAVFR